jgi:drug/metabolite transporter (DMT)-like permease
MSTGSVTGRATAIGVIAIALWSTLALLTVQAHGLPPLELLCLSFSVAFVAGIAVLALRGRAALVQLRAPAAAWGLSFGGIFLYHVLYFFALAMAPPAVANLINYLWPLLLVLLSVVLGGAGLRARHIGGALLGLAGTAVLLAGHGTIGAAGGAVWMGYLAALGGAVVWAGYSTLNRRFDSVPSAMIVGVCGGVALAGGLCQLAVGTWMSPLPGQWLAIVLLGLGPTGLAFMAWDHATKHGHLPVLGALGYLVPLLSTVLLVAAGRTPADPTLFLAAGLIVGGAVIASARAVRRS